MTPTIAAGIDENDDQTVTLTGCALLATILATASTPGFAQQPAQYSRRAQIIATASTTQTTTSSV
jgi:hypothetical protein